MTVQTETRTQAPQTLVGDADVFADAWDLDPAYRPAPDRAQILYSGGVPTEAVRDLFDFRVRETPLYVPTEDGQGFEAVPGRKMISRPGYVNADGTTSTVYYGDRSEGWRLHPYSETLVDKIDRITSHSPLRTHAAGTWRKGGAAFVQYHLPETMTVEGFGFRPFLTTITSLDGGNSSTFMTGATALACYNAMRAAMATGIKTRFRHTQNSTERMTDEAIAEAVGLVYETADMMADSISTLTRETVNERVFRAFVASLTKVPETASTRTKNAAEEKAEALKVLWTRDPRVQPWAGTAFGVAQMLSTYRQHQTGRETLRIDRNAATMANGDFQKADTATLDLLRTVKAANKIIDVPKKQRDLVLAA